MKSLWVLKLNDWNSKMMNLSISLISCFSARGRQMLKRWCLSNITMEQYLQKKIFIVIWNCFHCHLVNMSITLSKILARLYSLLSSHPAHYTATEYGSVFKTFFLAQTTVPRSERLIFHNVNACSDNFWMRNLFLSSSSSNPPLTPNWQIINNWDQLKLKKITVIVFNRKSVHALQEGWEKQKGDNIQLCCLTLILVILFIQVYIYIIHTHCWRLMCFHI